MTQSNQTFSLTLGLAAPVAELEAWLARALPRETAVYATGLDLPRDAAAVALVRKWAAARLVTLTTRRDPDDRRRTHWLVVRAGNSARDDSAEDLAMPADAACTFGFHERALLTCLEDAALAGEACPSLAAMAEAMRLPETNGRGRYRARYLLETLEKKHLITITRRAGSPRVITIRAAGRAQGRSTFG